MEENKKTKAPVVAVLGHVDHGKSSLLEAIRSEIRITSRESGGITQHIGAYEIEYPPGSKEAKKITFIDTPGHQAFSKIRERGAVVADIAILVIDASEGVKEQTKEAIEIIKNAEIPMIVTLNKIDKPSAQPEWVMGELKKYDVVVDKLGGDVPVVKTSAKTKEGIDDLLETILLVSEMENLEASPGSPARGIIIESIMDKNRGPVIIGVVRDGTLREGDIIASNTTVGKVKGLYDFQDQKIKEAGPSKPIKLLGFENLPKAGDEFFVFPTIDEARQMVEKSKKEIKTQNRSFGDSDSEEKNKLNIIIKTDVAGSLEAITGIVNSLEQDEVKINILEGKVGMVNLSDITEAETFGAVIFAFRVKPNNQIRQVAKQKKVKIVYSEVIYELIEQIKRELEKKIKPEIKRIDLGKMKVLLIFKKNKDGQIVGCRVIDGEITKGTFAEIVRAGEMLGIGKIKSLQQNKKDIPSAGKGKEVGILFESKVDLEENDILNVYKEETVKKTLTDNQPMAT